MHITGVNKYRSYIINKTSIPYTFSLFKSLDLSNYSFDTSNYRFASVPDSNTYIYFVSNNNRKSKIIGFDFDTNTKYDAGVEFGANYTSRNITYGYKDANNNDVLYMPDSTNSHIYQIVVPRRGTAGTVRVVVGNPIDAVPVETSTGDLVVTMTP